MMNAGGHGSETCEHLVSASIVDIRTGALLQRTPQELELGYRRSNVGPDQIVTSARFSTTPCSKATGEARIREITRWRKEHQPGGTINAGSVFRNPDGDAAGRLIDSAGLKGYRCGGAAVSEMHANFFAADEDAVAQDVWDLVWTVRRRVAEATGVWLTPEIRFAGVFDDHSGQSYGARGGGMSTNAMDHRIAERRHEVTEERARGRLRLLIWVVVLVGAIAAGVWLLNSPVLAIRSVVVTGAEQTDPSAVAADRGAGMGTPTISVRGGEIEAAAAGESVDRAGRRHGLLAGNRSRSTFASACRSRRSGPSEASSASRSMGWSPTRWAAIPADQ